MKKIFLPLALIICTLFIFSCKKKEGSQAYGDVDSGEDGAYVTSANGANYGYAMRVNTGFYVLEKEDTGAESDKTKWITGISLGEKLELGKQRKATYTGDGKIYDYIEVRRDNGNRGFATVTQIAPGGRLAVVVDEKANLYKSPKAIDVSGTIVSRKTIVIYYPETESNGFVEIKGYDPEIKAYIRQDNNYVRLSSLSRKESDVQSSILLQTAEPLKNEGQDKIKKDALLESAMLDYPDSAFSAEIQALASPFSSNVIQTESASSPFMTVNDNNVNIRSLPDASSGKVVGSLNNGDEVTISEQTTAEFTISGKKARWYHITEPEEGWVFGAYLE